MNRFFGMKWWLILIIYILLDVGAAGIGMGIPFFCIMLGFPTGWFLARRYLSLHDGIQPALSKILRDAFISSGITFAVMAAIWALALPVLFGAESDIADFGIPMILFEPRLSLIGWLVLMVFISPFLQLLSIIFTAYLTLIRQLRPSRKTGS
jgi:hypothetical protein